MLPQLLVAAGNYDIIAAVRRSMRPDRVVIKAAFTHRDMLYMLAQQPYTLLMVDATMIDRHTGEPTLKALLQQKSPLPTIAVALTEEAKGWARIYEVPMVTTLDKTELQNAVTKILNRYAPPRQTQIIHREEHPANAEAQVMRRSQELETMAQLSKSLTEVLDLPEVLKRVVEAARRLTDAEEGMILLPDENDPHRLVLQAQVGMVEELPPNFSIRVEDTLPGDVFRRGKPSLDADRDAIKFKTGFLVRSVLYVPILLQGKSLGVLGVNNRTRTDSFDLHQQELLENLASYASIAIQNAKIHEESVRKAKDLEALVKASQTISGTLIMEETLGNISQQLALVLKISRAEIYHWNRETNALELRAHFYHALWRGLKGPIIELSRNPAVKAALDADQHLLIPGEEFSTMLIPVTADGRLIGALRCFYVRPHNQSDVKNLADVRRVALDAMGAVLNQSSDSTEEDVFLLLDYINQLMEGDWCELSLLSAKGSTLIVLAMSGKGIWIKPPFQQMALASRPELEAVLRHQMILDPNQNRGVFALPLAHRGDAWGLVLLSHTDRSRTFLRSEVDIASALVSHAAIALENAQLVRDLNLSLESLREAQEKLVQTARLTAMGELAAVVAHQINNPLTTITVDTAMMLEYEPKDSVNYDALMAIYRAGKRASGVARRLLAISRPNDPNTPPEAIDVIDTVEGILQLVGSHIERRNIKIHTKLPDHPIPHVMAIKGQLDDVWLNLIMNAHDALADKPGSLIGVEVAHRQLDERIIVRVWDNGPGIPDELKDRIFKPFFTTKPPGEGTGLGLHVCRQVVEQCQGTITVESEVGKGTRFTVELPTVKNAAILEKFEEVVV